MQNERIFIIQSERRNWTDRIQWCLDQNKNLPPITRRYILMVKNPEIRQLIQNQFETLPYDKGGTHQDIFYCLAQPSYRRPKELVKAILYKLSKVLDQEVLNKIEILEGINAMETLMVEYPENN